MGTFLGYVGRDRRRFMCWERSQKKGDLEKAKKDIIDKGSWDVEGMSSQAEMEESV